MAMSKATIVMVPGAFHLDTTFDLLRAEIHTAGYETRTGTLRSVNTANASLIDDIDFVRNQLLLPLIDLQGKDVILLCHSYAGLPVSSAIKGLSSDEYALKKQAGGITGIIYMCAFLPKEGLSLYKMLGGKWSHWHAVNEETGLVKAEFSESVFYGDVPEVTASKAIATLQSHSLKALTDPAQVIAYTDLVYNNRRAYIQTVNDGALPASKQDIMIESSGVGWIVKKMNTSHSPFLSQPRELCAIIVDLAKKFASEK